MRPYSGLGFLALLLGGAIAAAGGFGAARYPDQWPFVSADAVDPVTQDLAGFSERLASLESMSADLTDKVTALEADDSLQGIEGSFESLKGEMGGAVDEVRTQYDALATQFAELESRLQTVEKLPQGAGTEAAEAAAAAYERELGQMRQMLDTELARINTAQEDATLLEVSAAESAKAAAGRAAMARVMTAMETGLPFGDALSDVTENTGQEVPETLASIADSGVITQAALQESFPEAARAALDASIRAGVESGSIDRVSAFFRSQLGTRSLAPKEGNDPDAILSRAEAALSGGDVEATLSELATMPESAQPALSSWIETATARKDALAAAADLAQQLNNN